MIHYIILKINFDLMRTIFETISPMIFSIIVFVLMISLRNYIQTLIATKAGDLTAKAEGFLSMNPLRHIDLLGILLFTISGFGWSKKPPINEYNIPKRLQRMLVYLSPTLVNILFILLSLLVLVILKTLNINPTYTTIVLLTKIIYTNLAYLIIHMIPLPPLDGYYVLTTLLPRKLAFSFETLKEYTPWIIALILSPYSPAYYEISNMLSIYTGAILGLVY